MVFEGEAIGKRGETIGEAVFTTGMTGYVETLTDPSFFGQIITFAFPMIGNYGAMEGDCESGSIFAAGCILRELCGVGSNFRKDCDLNEFLIKNGVVGIAGVDTREITKKIRTGGVINAMISDNIKDMAGKLAAIKAFTAKGAVENTSCKKVIRINAESAGCGKDLDGDGKTVVLWDFGAKENIQRELLKRGLNVIRVPHNTSAKEILEYKPCGVLLSNGGGDPAENKIITQEIKLLMNAKIPMFGICLGHQLMCLAVGAKARKLKFGHRGENQPVRDLTTGRVYITSQNHGYTVLARSLPEGVARLRYINVNDKSCEGVDFLTFPGFSVQFHPEASGGPRDTEWLFDHFVEICTIKNAQCTMRNAQ